MVREYKSAFNEFTKKGRFAPDEMACLGKVYAGLWRRSLQNLDELTMVITSGKLRMSDDERLQAIDRVYHSISDQYAFLQDFNSAAGGLSLQRQKEQMDIDLMRNVHGVK